MLVLSRKQGQSIFINGDIQITVVSIRGSQVRIGIEAPPRWLSCGKNLRAGPASNGTAGSQPPARPADRPCLA